jgi:cytoskeletal protein CcmA (bactofilin family)
MVFRRDSKVDAFQRQISALRQQLGGDTGEFPFEPVNRPPARDLDEPFLRNLPDLDMIRPSGAVTLREPDIVPDAAPPLAAPAIRAADAHTSVIAHTTTWNGNLESSGSLHVHGRVEGSVTARDDVHIAEEAQIDASIFATNVTIAGQVRGSIQCLSRFEVLPRGRFTGDVQAPIIVIHEGAVMAADVSMAQPGDSRAQLPAPSERLARGGD